MKKKEIFTVISALIISSIIVFLTEDIETGLYAATAFIFGLITLFMILKYPLLGILFIISFDFFSSLISIPMIQSVGRLAGVLVAVGWLLKHFYRGETVLFKYLKVNVVPLCFILSMLISSGVAADPMGSFKAAIVVTLFILMSFFIQDFIRSERDLKVVIATMALSVGVGSLIALIQYNVVTTGGNAFGEVMHSQTGEVTRVGGFADTNSYGALLMSGIPALLFFSLNNKNIFLKGMCFLFFITSFVSLFLSGARTHMFSFVVFLCSYLFFSLRHRTIKIKQLLLFLVTIVVMAVLISNFLIQFIDARSIMLDDGSSETRFLILKKGISLFIEHPMLGIGLNNLSILKTPGGRNSYYVDSKDSHDIVSGVFASLGLLGSLLLMAIFYKTYCNFNSAAKNCIVTGNEYILNLTITLKAAFLALLLTGLGNTLIFDNKFWIYVALSAVINTVSSLHRENEKATSADVDDRYLIFN